MRRRGRSGRGRIASPPMAPMTFPAGLPVQSPGGGQMPVPTKGSVVGAPVRWVAQVDSESCTGCGRCVSVCPAQAISFDPAGRAMVNTALCQSCGVCASHCPVQAISFVAPAMAK